MILEKQYKTNKERILTLLPNCKDRFLRLLDDCWTAKVYFIVPKEGAKRTTEEQLILLSQGRTFTEVQLAQKRLGLNAVLLEAMKSIYSQGWNKKGNVVTWSFHSKHVEGKALDILPCNISGALLSGKEARDMLNVIDHIGKEYGCFRPAETFAKGDYAHFEDYDLDFEEKRTEKYIERRNKRLRTLLN